MTLGLNQWLNHFPHGPYMTCLVLAAVWDAVLWTLLLIVFLVVIVTGSVREGAPEPQSVTGKIAHLLRFVGRTASEVLQTLGLLLAIGTLEALAGLASAYAVDHHAPEVAQAGANAAVVPLTAVMAIFLLHSSRARRMAEARKFLSALTVISLLTLVAGVLVLALAGQDNKKGNKVSAWWAMPLYALSVVFNAWHFVLQSLFMRRFTARPIEGIALNSDEVNSLGSEVRAVGKDVVVKVVMLAVDTFFQLLATLAASPIDTIPGFGRSATLTETFQSVRDGLDHARNSGSFGLYIAGFAVSHVAMTYLNHYNATFVALVTVAAAPVTAIVLVIHPAWDVNGEVPPAWAAAVAVTCLVVSTVSFAAAHHK
jgi:hypothetical protein